MRTWLREEILRRVLRNAGLLGAGKAAGAILHLAGLALTARMLGPVAFGLLIVLRSYAQAASGLARFQSWQTLIRFGAVRAHEGDRAGFRDLAAFTVALDAATGLVAALAAILLAPVFGLWFGVTPESIRLAQLYCVVIPLMASATPTGILRLHDRYAKGAVADSVTSVVRIIGSAIAFVVSPTIPAFLLAWAAGELVTAGVYWFYALQQERLNLRAVSLTRLPKAEPGAWGFVWGTGLSGTLLIASRQLIVLLVGAFGGAAMAGIYRVAAQLGEGLLKLAQALLRATYPELVRDPDQAHHIARRIGQIALVTGIATVAVAVLAGHWVLDIIAGPEYRAAYVPMIILSAAAAVELAGASL